MLTMSHYRNVMHHIKERNTICFRHNELSEQRVTSNIRNMQASDIPQIRMDNRGTKHTNNFMKEQRQQ